MLFSLPPLGTAGLMNVGPSLVYVAREMKGFGCTLHILEFLIVEIAEEKTLRDLCIPLYPR